MSIRVEICSSLAGVSASDWNALLEPDDAPLLSWEYLEGLERAGCVGAETGWQPLHILLRRGDNPSDGGLGDLVAAAPSYVKYDSDGEWVFDMDWASFAGSLGISYYPKLVSAVPFNPVSGGRLLCSPGLPLAERSQLRGLLLAVFRHVVTTAKLSSAHVLFHRQDEQIGALLEQAGYLQRRQEQYHFHNPGYRSFDDFLAELTSHRRTAIRRERRTLREAGISVRTYRGLDRDGGFRRDQLDAMFDMYTGTSERYTGGAPYLNRAFFHLCAERLGPRLELVLAYRGSDELVGGAWNLLGETRLFGRYWGEACTIPFLHFEVCYYHPIERCISEGLRAFEPGHGGEHKLLRGFSPVYTHSAHYLHESNLRLPIAAFLELEARHVEEEVQAAIRRCPLRRPRRWLASVSVASSPAAGVEPSEQPLDEDHLATPMNDPSSPADDNESSSRSRPGRRKTNGLTR